MSEPLLVAKSRDEIFLLPALANWHGLIAGATGTGKPPGTAGMAGGRQQPAAPGAGRRR